MFTPFLLATLAVDPVKVTAAETVTAPVGAPTDAAAQEQAPAPVGPAKPAARKGVPKLELGPVTITPRARFHLDVGNVSGPADAATVFTGRRFAARRIRFGAEAAFSKAVKARVEADIHTDVVTLVDAYLEGTKGPVTVRVGQQNIAQSLEELTSSNDSSFMERAAFTDAFGFERRIGVAVEFAKSDWLAQAGVSTETFLEINDGGTSPWGANARLVYAPKLGSTQLHLGAHASYRDQPGAGGEVRYRQRPFLNDVSARPVATPRLGSAGERAWGLEGAVIDGRWHGYVEAHWNRVDLAAPGAADPTFMGLVAEAGVFLTDDGRGYRGGVFRGPKVKRSVLDGGPGAIQLVGRYDRIDLSDAGIVGGTQDGWLAGVNWWLVPQVRVMLNYARMRHRDAAVPVGGRRDYSLDAIGTRLQIAF